MNYQSTKFIQTTLVILLGFVLTILKHLDGALFVTLALGALANYAYHDVKQKRID